MMDDDINIQELSDMYSFEYTCDNCGESDEYQFSKGERRPPAVVCNNCGCMTKNNDGTGVRW